MMHLTVTDSGTLGILTLRGSLAEHHAGELQRHLTGGLDRSNRLIVNCERVASIDMTCLKLLCTAYRVSRMLKKDFAVIGDRATLFHRATETDTHPGCSGEGLACEAGCLWEDSNNGRYGKNVASTPAPDATAA